MGLIFLKRISANSNNNTKPKIIIRFCNLLLVELEERKELARFTFEKILSKKSQNKRKQIQIKKTMEAISEGEKTTTTTTATRQKNGEEEGDYF